MKSPEKFVSPLLNDQSLLLKDLMKKTQSERVRMRAHSILLSSKKFSIDDISSIYDVNRNTVSIWLDSWIKNKVEGLFDNPRSGAPLLFSDSQIKTIKEIIEETPQSPKTILSKIAKNLKKK